MFGAAPAFGCAPFVRAIEFSTDVNPVSADYLKAALKNAETDGASAAVIVLDTPGGLSESMRDIVKAELDSKIPVLVYVPTGARAASAGVWIAQGRRPRWRWRPPRISAPQPRSTSAAGTSPPTETVRS